MVVPTLVLALALVAVYAPPAANAVPFPDDPCNAATESRSTSITPQLEPAPSGYVPRSIATGDFNGDGIEDVVVAGTMFGFDLRLTSLDDYGLPSFTSGYDASGDYESAECAVVADVDGSGTLDLVIVASYPSGVPPSPISERRQPYLYSNADGNGLSWSVISVAEASDFNSKTNTAPLSANSNPCVTAFVDDISRDGDVEAVFINANGGAVYSYSPLDKKFTFVTSLEVTGGGSTTHADAVLSDFDGDTVLDLAILLADGQLEIALGLPGDDMFARGNVIPGSGGLARSLLMDDMDGDGLVHDFIIFTQLSVPPTLIRELGPSSWDSPQPLTIDTGGVSMPGIAVAIDFDGDGVKDIFGVGSSELSEGSFFRRTSASTAAPAFALHGELRSRFDSGCPNTPARALAVADINKDGIDELVVSQPCQSSPSAFVVSTRPLMADRRELGHQNVFARSDALVVEDFNGDALPDIYGGAWLSLARDGQGGFNDPYLVLSSLDVNAGYIDAAALDFDADGDMDLFSSVDPASPVATTAAHLRTATSTPLWVETGGVAPGATSAWLVVAARDTIVNVTVVHFEPDVATVTLIDRSATNVAWIQAADIDGDATADIVVAQGKHLYVARNIDGTGRFPGVTEASLVAFKPSGFTFDVASFVIADVDNDNVPDVVAAGPSQVEVAFGTSGAVLADVLRPLVVTTSKSAASPATALPLTVGDVDNDGFADIIVRASGLKTYINLLLNRPAPGPTQRRFAIAALVEPISGSYSSGTAAIVATDLTGDGLLDVVTHDRVAVNQVSAFRGGTITVHGQLATALNAGARTWNASRVASVDVVSCGYTIHCIVKAYMAFPACSGGATPTLTLPAGTYTGCRVGTALQLRRSVNLVADGAVTLDCSAGSATVTLDGINLVAGTTAPGDPRGTTALSVIGASSHLVLRNLAVSGASSEVSPSAVAQILPGYGGALLVADGASAELVNVDAMNNTAAVVGAFFVLAPSGARAALRVYDSDISDNTADGGSGGGGAVALRAADGGSGLSSELVVLARTTLARNTARWGGALAAFTDAASVTANLPRSAGELSRAASGRPSALTRPAVHAIKLTDAVFVDNAAAYGGTLFTCGVPVAASMAAVPSTQLSSRAEIGGGFAFACSAASDDASASSWSVSTPSFAGLPWLGLDAGMASMVGDGSLAALYGRVMGTPLARVESASTTAVLSKPSGVPVGQDLAFRGYDALGSPVIDKSLVLEVTLAPATAAAGFQLGGGDPRAFFSRERVAFPEAAVSLVSLGAGAQVFGADYSGSVAVELTAKIESDTNLSGSLQVLVTACPVGSGRVSRPEDAVVCGVCQEGTLSANISLAPCEPELVCSEGFFLRGGVCVTCDANQVQVSVGRDNATEACVCQATFYTPDALPDTRCLPCPDGGVCAGGTAAPVASDGFYDVTNPGGSAAFAACRRPSACSGGTEVCNNGYSGYMCTRCLDGYYSDPSRRCQKCPAGSGGLFGFVCVAVFVVAFCFAGYLAIGHRKSGAALVRVKGLGGKGTVRDGESGGEAEFEEKRDARTDRSRSVPYSLSMGLLFLQILGVLGTVQLSWPSQTRDSLSAFNALNMDMSLFATECTLTTFAAKYYLGLVWPLVMIVVLVLCWFVLRLLGVGRADDGTTLPLSRLLEGVLFTLGPLAYIPLSRSALILFDCTQLPNGDFHLDADLGERCYVDGWWSLLPAGILGVLLYVVAVPAYMAYVLYTQRDGLFTDETVLARYGSLYKLYKRRFFYMEIVLLGKRLLIVVVSLFFSDLQLWLVGGLLVVFLGFAFVEVRWEPYYLPVYNVVSIQIDLVLSTLLLLGFAFYADRFPSATSRDVLMVFSIIMVVLGCLALLFGLVRELLGRRQREAVDLAQTRFWSMLDKEGADWVDQTALERVWSIREEASPTRALAPSGSTVDLVPASRSEQHIREHILEHILEYSLELIEMAGEREARSVQLSPRRFVELNRNSEPFGFLAGGRAQLWLTYSANEAHGLRFLFCTDQQVARINREFGSVGALCDGGDEVQCTINAPVANGSYAMDMVMTEKNVYYALLGNCEASSASVHFAYVFVNPGGEHLSFGYIPMPSMYTWMAAVWCVAFVAWAGNRIVHWNRPIGLNSVVGALGAAKIVWALVAAWYWTHLSRFGVTETRLDLVYYAALVACRCLFLALVLLYAMGWCITLAALPQPMQRMLWACTAILAATTVFDTYSHSYYLFIVVIVYVMLLRAAFSALADNIRTVRLQLLTVESGNIDPITTPINHKLLMFRWLQSALVYFIVARVLVSIVAVFAFSHYPWITALLAELLELGLYCFLGYVLRLRNFAPYEEAPLATGSGQASSHSGAASRRGRSAASGAHLDRDMASARVVGTLTRSAIPAPRRSGRNGPLQTWRPGMALPNTPAFAAVAPPSEPHVALVVYPAAPRRGGSRNGGRDDDSQYSSPLVAAHFAIGVKIDDNEADHH
ncbi:uncharacterized protein AMSG_11847 [Thecamonas trahens ATCC 50062]|uniref:Tyrosine-protein kinase ephrin type A/B receptor-like domain-containing protein n=1 Tax=Thecamonas trahens ATCC 50062 TaxID=461836 RepID=A0A0L0DAK1_THETB|nr:hypothetical protein AMSG_11847 [Thecamonas trahens ATCC 50062]KNC49101.1 hypothetical protein AMSG_11847 [Thecamonas trahens ATCC 50062]|eukprot:XP_013758226.1 hypothetical protein AMSG_11847 [Thecamonas trahens ATCC 50062]